MNYYLICIHNIYTVIRKDMNGINTGNLLRSYKLPSLT